MRLLKRLSFIFFCFALLGFSRSLTLYINTFLSSVSLEYYIMDLIFGGGLGMWLTATFFAYKLTQNIKERVSRSLLKPYPQWFKIILSSFLFYCLIEAAFCLVMELKYPEISQYLDTRSYLRTSAMLYGTASLIFCSFNLIAN